MGQMKLHTSETNVISNLQEERSQNYQSLLDHYSYILQQYKLAEHMYRSHRVV